MKWSWKKQEDFPQGRKHCERDFTLELGFLKFAMSLHKECVIEKGNPKDIKETEEEAVAPPQK